MRFLRKPLHIRTLLSEWKVTQMSVLYNAIFNPSFWHQPLQYHVYLCSINSSWVVLFPFYLNLPAKCSNMKQVVHLHDIRYICPNHLIFCGFASCVIIRLVVQIHYLLICSSSPHSSPIFFSSKYFFRTIFIGCFFV